MYSRGAKSPQSALMGVAWQPLHCPHGMAPIAIAMRSPSPWLCGVPRTLAAPTSGPMCCVRICTLASKPPQPSTTALAWMVSSPSVVRAP